MSFIPNETFGVNLVRNTPDGELHAERHMKLCCSIDMTSLSVVLNAMVKDGHVSRRQADAFSAQAGGLLATMLTENHRGHSRHDRAARVGFPVGTPAPRICNGLVCVRDRECCLVRDQSSHLPAL